jgi:hypothetical protein
LLRVRSVRVHAALEIEKVMYRLMNTEVGEVDCPHESPLKPPFLTPAPGRKLPDGIVKEINVDLIPRAAHGKDSPYRTLVADGGSQQRPAL